MSRLFLFLVLAFSIPLSAQNVLGDSSRVDDFLNKKFISLVFSSQNLSIPETLFGHTFVVAHNQEFPEPDATVLEFVGLPDGSWPSYFHAVTSDIGGQYQIKAFYEKQYEYDLENRDFWIYPYTGSVEDRQRLVEKLKIVLQQPRVPYNFITKNCATAAYVVLSNDPLEKPYVLPVATINWLQSEELLGEGHFHPSRLRKAMAAYLSLNSTQQSELRQQLTDAPTQLALFKDDAKGAGALNAGLNFLIPRQQNTEKSKKLFKLKQSLFDVAKEEESLEMPYPPEQRSQRESIVIGRGERNYSIEFRPAQRDFLTSSRDGHETSFLEVIKIRGDLIHGDFKFSEFTLFRLDTQSTSTLYSPPFTRWIELGYWDWQRQAPERRGEFVAHYGWGYSFKLQSLTLGLLPFAGFTKGLGLDQSGLDLGFRVAINMWINERFAWQTVYKHRWQVDRLVADTWDTGVLYRMLPNWRWGISWIKAADPLETLEIKAIFTF